MSYTSISACAVDPEFINRVTACIAQETRQGAAQPAQPSTLSMASSIIWNVASASDIEAAYSYALDIGNAHPGGDPTVISDQMILSAVQPLLPQQTPPPV